MARFLDNMKLSVLLAAVALAAVTSAHESAGSSIAARAGEEEIPPALIPFLKKLHHVTIAHGTIMCLAFVIFFPAGSFVIRLGHFKGAVYVHAAIQMFAYMMAIAGMGLGSFVAHAPTKLGRKSLFSKYHPIIGFTIIAALLFQPALGVLHHAVYVRTHRRSIWSTLHVWWGRVVLTLAIIQGGLGLKFADNTHGGKVAYGVVAGLIWVSWLGVAVWHDTKKSSTANVAEKRSDSEEMTPVGRGEAGLA